MNYVLLIVMALSLFTASLAIAQDPRAVDLFSKQHRVIDYDLPPAWVMPVRRRCVIDLSKKSRVAVRVNGSSKTVYYPVRQPSRTVNQAMAVDQTLARELLNAPAFRAYAVPKFGISYGYNGQGLLVFGGLFIDECPLPPLWSGLFVPVSYVQPYINRDFLTRYFVVIDP